MSDANRINFSPWFSEKYSTDPTKWVPRLHVRGRDLSKAKLLHTSRYYYRIAPVDRWSNEGPPSAPIAVKTLRSREKNAIPLQVKALHAILVSELTPQNYVNLLFRTNPESDVNRYEIHRSNKPAVEIEESTRIGMADTNGIVKGATQKGHVPVDHRMGEYDHMMYQDDTVKPSITYYYPVCAVDTAGQRGRCSVAASVCTK